MPRLRPSKSRTPAPARVAPRRRRPGDPRPSPGSIPPENADLRDGAEVTVTAGPDRDAVDHLQAEHREITALVARGPRALARLAAAIAEHVRQEEEVFYPALRGVAARGFAPVLADAIRTNRTIDRLAQELSRLPSGGRRTRFDELRARIEEHVTVAEKSVFPEALRRLSRPQRVSLGERMDLLAQDR